MGDFFRPGVITTLHRLRKNSLDRRETELEFFSWYNPIALVLPSLYCGLKKKALKTIVSEIQKMKYVTQVIVTLGRTKEKEFEHAKEFFSVLPPGDNCHLERWRKGTISLRYPHKRMTCRCTLRWIIRFFSGMRVVFCRRPYHGFQI